MILEVHKGAWVFMPIDDASVQQIVLSQPYFVILEGAPGLSQTECPRKEPRLSHVPGLACSRLTHHSLHVLPRDGICLCMQMLQGSCGVTQDEVSAAADHTWGHGGLLLHLAGTKGL